MSYPKSLALGALLLGLGVATTALAAPGPRDEDREAMRENRLEFRDTVQQVRASTTIRIKDINGEFRLEARNMRSGSSSTSTKRAEFEKLRDERKDDVREVRLEARSEITKAIVTRFVQRFEIATERFTAIADRLASRIEKIKADGGVTASAEANLATARVHIEAATEAKDDFADDVDAMTGSTTPAELRAAAKTAVGTIRTELDAAKKALQAAIDSLRRNNPTASSTSATS